MKMGFSFSVLWSFLAVPLVAMAEPLLDTGSGLDGSVDQVSREQASFEKDFVTDGSFSPQQEKELERVLEFAAKIRLERLTPLHEETFGPGLTGQVYVELLKKMPGYIFEKAEDSSSFAAFSPAKNAVILYDNFFSPSLGPIYRLSILIHEAVHGMNPSTGHILCPKKDVFGDPLVGSFSGQSLEGTGGCDIFHNHAYGTQVIALYNIAKYCVSCSPEERERAEVMAQQLSRRIIFKVALDILLTDKNSERLE